MEIWQKKIQTEWYIQDGADVFPFDRLEFKILQEGGSIVIQNKFKCINKMLHGWKTLYNVHELQIHCIMDNIVIQKQHYRQILNKQTSIQWKTNAMVSYGIALQHYSFIEKKKKYEQLNLS